MHKEEDQQHQLITFHEYPLKPAQPGNVQSHVESHVHAPQGIWVGVRSMLSL